MCSLVARAGGEDAIASAVPWERCLVLEVELPWAREVTESRHFDPRVQEAVQRAQRRGVAVNVQGLVRDPEYSVLGHTRVMDLRRPAGPFARYHRDEFVAPDEEVGALAQALLEGTEDTARYRRYRREVTDVRDLLVCTHGSRDPCCARFGASVYETLRTARASAYAEPIRVWRTSHTGGHRFAANVIDLPEARFWGWVDEGRAAALLSRSGPVNDLRRCYRGWAGLATPFEQVAEREAFMRRGWQWAAYSKAGRLLSVEEGGRRAEVRIEFAAPDGSVSGAYEATVESAGAVPYTVCLPTSKPGQAEQYRLVRFAEAAG